MNSKRLISLLVVTVALFVAEPSHAASTIPPTWGQFRRLEAVVTKLVPESNLAAFTVTITPRRKPAETHTAHLVVLSDTVYFTPAHRPKRKGAFADLRVGMRVLVSGIQSTNGSYTEEVFILDAAK